MFQLINNTGQVTETPTSSSGGDKTTKWVKLVNVDAVQAGTELIV
jgi:hypothetical protein